MILKNVSCQYQALKKKEKKSNLGFYVLKHDL